MIREFKRGRDEQRAVVVGVIRKEAVEVCALADVAIALADLGMPDAAEREMATSRGLWSPTRADPFGDLDRPAALLALRRGRLDGAESFAAVSVRRWEGISQVGHAQSGIVRAAIHVQAGEPSGVPLAHSVITAVTKLSSIRARRRLEPLVAALEARPGRDERDLARMARQVSSARVWPGQPRATARSISVANTVPSCVSSDSISTGDSDVSVRTRRAARRDVPTLTHRRGGRC